jgi:uncharacterized membrane protein
MYKRGEDIMIKLAVVVLVLLLVVFFFIACVMIKTSKSQNERNNELDEQEDIIEGLANGKD